MPCGLRDCTNCDSCIYDKPLDSVLPHNKSDNTMSGILIQETDNKATKRLIGCSSENSASQSSITTSDSNKLFYCNNCPNLFKTPSPDGITFNYRCKKFLIEGSERLCRVIKVGVMPDTVIWKPYWCPIKSDNSMLSQNEQERWNESKKRTEQKNKWLNLHGITAWDDIHVGENYHMPPMFEKGRMDIHVRAKYINSIQCTNIKTGTNMWIYKYDEEYKFMSKI